MPCRRSYCPVRIDARLTQQIEVVTKLFLKRTPWLASRSMFGVCTTLLPVQPSASQRRSSARIKTMFGGGSAARAGESPSASDTPRTSHAQRRRFIGNALPLTNAGKRNRRARTTGAGSPVCVKVLEHRQLLVLLRLVLGLILLALVLLRVGRLDLLQFLLLILVEDLVQLDLFVVFQLVELSLEFF